MTEKPKYNSQLWFEHRGCKGKHYITGNPHTDIGRIYAWCPKKQTAFCVSRSEIGDMSIETNFWIQGYLTGKQPPPPSNNNEEIDYESKEYKEWENKVRNLERTGEWE